MRSSFCVGAWGVSFIERKTHEKTERPNLQKALRSEMHRVGLLALTVKYIIQNKNNQRILNDFAIYRYATHSDRIK